MSVLVFLHKNEYVEWHKVVIYIVEVEKWKLIKKLPGTCGQMKTTKLLLELTLKHHTFSMRKICTILAKMTKPLLHVLNISE